MKIIAHRGDSANHPENTQASWESAYAAGTDAVEVDIRFSSDGVGVCAHDANLQRLFGRSERPQDLSFAELQTLRNGEGARILPLAEVLKYPSVDRTVLLDLKDETPRGLELLWQSIEENVPPAARHLVIAGCHSLEAVRFLAERGGVVILGFIQQSDAGPDFVAAGASIIRLWECDVVAERVAPLKNLGVAIWVTAGEGTTGRLVGDASPEGLLALRAAGVDGVLVNDVTAAFAALEVSA